MNRMGSALGLNTTPSFYFRFSRYEVDDETRVADIHEWDTYNTTDQLTVMARLAFFYQHRKTEPSFTIMLRENHLLSINCLRHGSVYNLNISLNRVYTNLRSHSHTPHAVEFVLTSGAQNPFPEFEFVWRPNFEDE
jgi:hypothetical protein